MEVKRAMNPALCVGFPLIAALAVLFVREQRARAWVVRICAAVIMLLAIAFAVTYFPHPVSIDLTGLTWLPYGVLLVEVSIGIYVVVVGLRARSWPVVVLSLLQMAVAIGYEFAYGHAVHVPKSLYIDRLSILMVLIAGVIGGLICIFAVEYMKDYHRHHPEVADRRSFFYAVMFVFLAAMMGLVIACDMSLLILCWEITSLCSFLFIGYTKTAEAGRNARLALTLNVGGGLLLTAGAALLGALFGVHDFESLLTLNPSAALVSLAVLLMGIGALTKSAQMPFSGWLLGAMVAPTPVSALLHSSTMVKAGVYLIIRLAPMLGQNVPGLTITLVGGVTFLAAAAMAVSQSDAKKVLAYSTISNLGLIVACTAIDTAEALWAAIMLIVFHAIAKSLLFLSVGSTEHQLGSRDIEDMDGLFRISPQLTLLLIIGIAGMFVAPFGMLISKWAAMKAIVDSGNVLLLLMVAFGSSITLFFWTKWMGKLIANAHRVDPTGYIMRGDEKAALYPLAGMVAVVCALHPLISSAFIVPYIDSNMHINFTSPIDPADTTIIILMMCILFLLPVLLIPLYRRSRRVHDTSMYLSGQNTGDNEHFYGSMGETPAVELRNWYMTSIFGPERWEKRSQALCAGLLVVGVCVAVGSVIFL